MGTDVLEECITTIFRVKNQPSKNPVCRRCLAQLMEVIGSSEMSVHICTTKRYIPEYGNTDNNIVFNDGGGGGGGGDDDDDDDGAESEQ
jgi:hypothetical protein